MDKIKLGFAPTRRSIFSAPDAIKYRGLTADRLTELGIDYVDITVSTANMKEFLYLRDTHRELDAVKKAGAIGVPCFLQGSSGRRKSTDCSFPTATSAPSMNVQGLPRNWGSRCFYGGR